MFEVLWMCRPFFKDCWWWIFKIISKGLLKALIRRIYKNYSQRFLKGDFKEYFGRTVKESQRRILRIILILRSNAWTFKNICEGQLKALKQGLKKYFGNNFRDSERCVFWIFCRTIGRSKAWIQNNNLKKALKREYLRIFLKDV